MPSLKLAIITRKQHKAKREEIICKFCDLNEVEDEFHFLLQCSNYMGLGKELIDYIMSTENIDLALGKNVEN